MSNIITGRQLRAARILAGLTQKQLSNAAGVHERAARYWELKEDKAPTSTPSSLEKIETVLRDHGVIVFATPTAGVRLATVVCRSEGISGPEEGTECIAVAGSSSCTVPVACLPAVTATGLPREPAGIGAPARAGKSQKIRLQLGGSPNMLEEFPEKPKGMHWRTYERWRRVHDAAEERSTIGLMGF